MTDEQDNQEHEIDIDLRDASWAALLGWLWPGAGHIYQRRYGKGMLFMICILAIYFFGLALGGGRVVYASWKPNDRRWQYVCQFGVGVPALPAVIQSLQVKNGGKPFFILTERYHPDVDPYRKFEPIPPEVLIDYKEKTLTDGLMAPPAGEVTLDQVDVLGMWYAELRHKFQLGTLYTVVAGLLNFLAIYDAFAGPVVEQPDEREKRRKKKSDDDSNDEESN